MQREENMGTVAHGTFFLLFFVVLSLQVVADT